MTRPNFGKGCESLDLEMVKFAGYWVLQTTFAEETFIFLVSEQFENICFFFSGVGVKNNFFEYSHNVRKLEKKTFDSPELECPNQKCILQKLFGLTVTQKCTPFQALLAILLSIDPGRCRFWSNS